MTKGEPRFSVVIPCYNQGMFIDECLASLAAQTLAPHEIIVVNDGSTDPWTTEHLREVCVPPIRLIEQANGGPAAARNAGVRAATGDWIVPLDGDDQLTPDALATYAAAIAREPNVEIWNPDVEHFGTETAVHPTREFNAWQELSSNHVMCNAAIRRAVFDRASYNERMRAGFEDWEFYVHTCCELGVETRNLGVPVFRYRRWGYGYWLDMQSRIATLSELLHRERPIFSDNEKLATLKQRWSPYFAIATNGEGVRAALVRQSFTDVAIIDDTGRVDAEQNLTAFHGRLGHYLLVSVAHDALAAALDANPYLLENVAILCESRSPSLVWLVAIDDAESSYPGGVIEPQPGARSPACLGYLVSAKEFFDHPEILKRRRRLVDDLAWHMRTTSTQPAFHVVAGVRRGDEPVDAPVLPPPEPWQPPPPPAKWRRATGLALELALGEEGKERLMHTRSVSALRKLVRREPPPLPTVVSEHRAGPLSADRLANPGKRYTDWLVAQEPARFVTPVENDRRPGLMLALPWITHGGVDRSVIDLLHGIKRSYPHVRTFVVTTHKLHAAPLYWAPEVLSRVDGFISLGDLAEENIGPALVQLIERHGIDALLIDQSQHAYDALPLIRKLPQRVRVVSHLHAFERNRETGERSGFPLMAPSRFDNLIDAYATISRTLAEELSRYCYVSPTKIRPIFLGADVNRFAAARRERLTKSPAMVLWLGRLSEEKDPIRFLDVANAWREKHGAGPLKFLLGGGGWIADRVRRVHEEYRLEDVVTLLGPVNDPMPLYEQADCLMLTSRFEGIPVVIYEAMAAGLPIVTPVANTAIPDVLRPDHAWFIDDPRSADDYVRALEQILADPNEARARARQLEVRSANYSIERYTRQMIEVVLPQALVPSEFVTGPTAMPYQQDGATFANSAKGNRPESSAADA